MNEKLKNDLCWAQKLSKSVYFVWIPDTTTVWHGNVVWNEGLRGNSE